jgi:hypothetical protein
MRCHSVGCAHENNGAATTKHYRLEETSQAWEGKKEEGV